MFDKEEHKNIVNQYGDKSTFVEKNEGVINIYENKSSLTLDEIQEKLNRASIDLKSYCNTFQDKKKIHIDRKETEVLYKWIKTDQKGDVFSIALLVANAGYGKSVILRDLLDKLNNENIPTLAIKVDRLQNVKTIKDLEFELNLGGGIVEYFDELKKSNTCVVFLIDQIDAISQSLTSNRSAIDSFNRLIQQYVNDQQVKIIISCRTFDLEYDPTLRSYKDQTIVRVSTLELTDVESVLQANNIEVDQSKKQLKEFLRVPLHLKLFCKVGLTGNFDNNITLQDLYNEIWKEYITTNTNQGIDIQNLVQLLYSIATKMTEQQVLIVDKRCFEMQSSKEQSYLLHHDLLQEQGQDKIQFIHQTFFDYAYARSFVSQEKSISDWLEGIHQGLFIRSQVKQLFAYLRDLDADSYIDELRTVLFDDKYRFHIKYMLVYDIAFYPNPLSEEKQLFFDLVNKDKLYFTLFVEAIQGVEWFKFIINTDYLKNLVLENTTDANNQLITLCRKIIWQDAKVVVEFLETIVDSNLEIVKLVLQLISGDNVMLAKGLYLKVCSNLQGSFYEYHILSEFIKKDIDFAIERMKLLFDEHLSHRSDMEYSNNYIPGGHEGLHLYDRLYKENSNKAIPYFLYVIEQISKHKVYETDKRLFIEFSFTHYRPDYSNIKEDYNEYTDLYDQVLATIDKKDVLDEESTTLILNSLESRHPNMLAIGVFYLLINVDTEIDRIFKLFTQDYFFKEIGVSEILRYYSIELLRKTYPLFSEEQQLIVNEYLLATRNIQLNLVMNVLSKKKYLPSYLYNTYKLLSVLPKQDRSKYSELKKIYQEGYRKYGLRENEEPQILMTRMGSPSYGKSAYEKMFLDDWYRSFLRLDNDRSLLSWDKPSKEGNVEQFKEHVSKAPSFYFDFINVLIRDKEISIDYVFAGMEGLQKSKFDIDKIQSLCLKVLQLREKELIERNLYPFLRIIEYIVPNNANVDREIFDFIKKLIYETKDREIDKTQNSIGSIGDGIELTAINLGINSIRGIAVQLLTFCYLLEEYKEEIFETLEYIADTANEVTRSCAIYKAAWLNNLDLDRAFDLYLRLNKDYNPYLLAMPFNDGHPLLYFINSHFEKLIPFFQKAIEVEEAGVSMSHFLIRAYINDQDEALPLLKKLLSNNTKAQCKLLYSISKYVLKGEDAQKGWDIVLFLLDFESQELANSFDICFWHLEPKFTDQLIVFLNMFVVSPQCQYPQEKFYDFLGQLIDVDVYKSKQCLEWFFASRPQNVNKEIFYKQSPLDVLFAGYNGIRDYDKKEPILEQVLDVFDDLLKLPNYRNFYIRKTFKELES